MTTTAFQYVFDNAESIGIDRRAVTAQTVARDNTVRTVSRGGQIWRFNVRLPDGMPWDTARPYIEAIDAADRYTKGVVQINNSGYNSWLTAYRGDYSGITTGAVSVTQGSTSATLTAPWQISGSVLKAGDIIQLYSGGTDYSVYSVTSDSVPGADPNSAITLNRPVLETTGSYNCYVGPACKWTVVCMEMPTWTISSRNQVSWSGAFSFYEALV